jgi:phage terminase small subunit
MPALKNARHEKFAQELAKGKTADEAYQLAGYRPNRGNATTLKANQSVRDRVEELTERAADKAVIDKAWVLDRLRQNAETCMALDFVKGPDGQATTAVTHNPAAASKALELLGKELGMFKDQVEQTVNGAMSVTYVTSATGPAPPANEEDYETD